MFLDKLSLKLTDIVLDVMWFIAKYYPLIILLLIVITLFVVL